MISEESGGYVMLSYVRPFRKTVLWDGHQPKDLERDVKIDGDYDRPVHNPLKKANPCRKIE